MHFITAYQFFIKKVFAKCTEISGNLKAKIITEDGKVYAARITGKMIKRSWVNKHDLVVATLQDYNPFADIIHKYKPDEVKQLEDLGLIDKNCNFNQFLIRIKIFCVVFRISFSDKNFSVLT